MPYRIYTVEKMQATKFGMLQPLELVEEGEVPHKNKWRCVCDCGGEVVLKERTITKLVGGRGRNCGCLNKMRTPGENHPHFRGYKGLSGRYMATIKQGAKARNLEFSITAEEAWNLYEKQNRKCALSGVPITMASRSDGPEYHLIQTASLDRIDSSIGYPVENLQWVHKRVNFMKQEMSDEEFVEWCRTITQHQGRAEETSDPVI